MLDGTFDIGVMSNIVVKSNKGGVAVLEWGNHLFVVDTNTKTVTMTAEASLSTAIERGVGRCD